MLDFKALDTHTYGHGKANNLVMIWCLLLLMYSSYHARNAAGFHHLFAKSGGEPFFLPWGGS